MPKFDIFLDAGVCIEADNATAAIQEARVQLAEMARYDSLASFVVAPIDEED